MNVSALLKTVNSGSSVEDILAGLTRLQTLAGVDPDDRAEVENEPQPEPGSEAFQAQLDDIRAQLLTLSDQFDRMSNKLTRFERQAHADLFGDLDGVLERTIINYQTGYEATLKYNEDWFADALLGEDSKAELASRLLTAIRKFCRSNLKTLELIADRDPGIMKQIQAPQQIRA